MSFQSRQGIHSIQRGMHDGVQLGNMVLGGGGGPRGGEKEGAQDWRRRKFWSRVLGSHCPATHLKGRDAAVAWLPLEHAWRGPGGRGWGWQMRHLQVWGLRKAAHVSSAAMSPVEVA